MHGSEEAWGYEPNTDYSGPHDLRQLPIFTRQDLQSLATWLTQANRHRGHVYHSDSSSGSIGIPIVIYRNAYERPLHIAKWMRVLFTNGYRIHQRVMAFCRTKRMDPGKSMVQKLGLLRRKGADYFLPTQQLTDRLFSYRPHVLYGNCCHLELVALDMKDRGLRCDFLNLLVVTGEVVHTNTRRLLRECYGVEPLESYGSVEMGVMAHETPARDGLQLLEDQTFFEFLDERDNPVPAGMAGRVIVTDLSQTVMPIIRYDQGDFAVYEERKHPGGGYNRRLKQIIGRDDDLILMPDGTRRANIDFDIVIGRFKEIRQFRIIQKTPTLFIVDLVVDKEDFNALKEEMIRLFNAKFSLPFRFELRHVNRIHPETCGKIRRSISEV